MPERLRPRAPPQFMVDPSFTDEYDSEADEDWVPREGLMRKAGLVDESGSEAEEETLEELTFTGGRELFGTDGGSRHPSQEPADELTVKDARAILRSAISSGAITSSPTPLPPAAGEQTEEETPLENWTGVTACPMYADLSAAKEHEERMRTRTMSEFSETYGTPTVYGTPIMESGIMASLPLATPVVEESDLDHFTPCSAGSGASGARAHPAMVSAASATDFVFASPLTETAYSTVTSTHPDVLADMKEEKCSMCSIS